MTVPTKIILPNHTRTNLEVDFWLKKVPLPGYLGAKMDDKACKKSLHLCEVVSLETKTEIGSHWTAWLINWEPTYY